MKKKRKRRLRLPFRIIRNIFIFILVMIILLYGIYAMFLKEDVNRLIKSYNDTVLVEEDTNDTKILKSSYSIAVLGVDEGVDSTGRTDSINIVDINANTNQMLITNVPRDTYINYECIGDDRSKINAAYHYGGISCTMNALNNLTKSTIDFYVIMDFDAFIAIIEQLGTISIDVPDFNAGNPWCEQTSNRVDEICFTEFGIQEVSAQQALAVARSRHNSSDLARGLEQQKIMNATISKLITIRDFNILNNVILSLDGKFKTNITIKQLSLMTYNYGKFKKSGNEFISKQVPGQADYFQGDLSYASYFTIDELAWDLQLKEREQFLKAE